MTGAPERVSLVGVAKVFGSVRALSRLDLTVMSGESVAVMGPNGAGKSTLLSVLSLTMRPTAGRVELDGREVRFGASADRAAIGLLSHQAHLYPEMTGLENLRFFARMYGLGGEAGRRIEELTERFGLSPFVADRPTRVLSRGQLQRVALARTMISRPRILLLDEPASGLDRDAVGIIEGVISEHRREGGIAVTVTHEPELAAGTAGRGVVLKAGRLVADRAVYGDADSWRAFYRDAVEGP